MHYYYSHMRNEENWSTERLSNLPSPHVPKEVDLGFIWSHNSRVQVSLWCSPGSNLPFQPHLSLTSSLSISQTHTVTQPLGALCQYAPYFWGIWAFVQSWDTQLGDSQNRVDLQLVSLSMSFPVISTSFQGSAQMLFLPSDNSFKSSLSRVLYVCI